MTESASKTILLVDDNLADVRLATEAPRAGDTECQLLIASDGEVALSILRREGEYSGSARPDLILLDLNLPKVDGWQVLAAVKGDPELECIPTVIVSTSAAEEDVRRAYGLRANCYLTKPADLDEYFTVLGSVQRFWLEVAKLPPAPLVA